jgi:hypothetical protein
MASYSRMLQIPLLTLKAENGRAVSFFDYLRQMAFLSGWEREPANLHISFMFLSNFGEKNLKGEISVRQKSIKLDVCQ